MPDKINSPTPAPSLKDLEENEILFREGDPSDSLILIKEGEIEVFVESDGVKAVLSLMKPGEILGTVTLFNKEPRSAHARATKPSKVQVISTEAARKNLSDVQPWIQTIVKDTISRLLHVNKQLLQTSQKLHRLERDRETILEKGTQLAGLLYALARVGLVDHEGSEVFPVKTFCAVAEGVFGDRAEDIQNIYQAFVKSGLVKEFVTQKYGPTIQKERIAIFNEFSIFMRKLQSDPEKQFVPLKLQPLMLGLSKLALAHVDKTNWDVEELKDLLSRQTGRTVDDDVIQILKEKRVLTDVAGCQEKTVTFSVSLVQKRNIFEETWRQLHELEKQAEVIAKANAKK